MKTKLLSRWALGLVLACPVVRATEIVSINGSSNQMVRIEFLAQPGRKQTLQFSTDLQVWSNLETRESPVAYEGTSAPERTLVQAPQQQGFFRVATTNEVANSEVLVRFSGQEQALASSDLLQDAGIVSSVGVMFTAQMRANGDEPIICYQTVRPAAETAAILNQSQLVEHAEPNYLVFSSNTPDDTYYQDGQLWGLYAPTGIVRSAYGIGADLLWAAGVTGSTEVVIGVIDSGCDTHHPDLAGNIWSNPGEIAGNAVDDDGNGFVDDVAGWDFYYNEADVGNNGDEDHGTHVAGTIGATGFDRRGVIGVCPTVRLLPVKFLGGPRGSGTSAGALASVNYLVDLKRRHQINLVAINNSWGGGAYSKFLHEAFIEAAKQGVLMVCAAGNQGINTDLNAYYPSCLDTSIAPTGTTGVSPAAWDAVVSVANLTESGELRSSSNRGVNTVDIAAPGTRILSTVLAGEYAFYTGTSMAAPHVAGSAALVAAATGSSGSALKELLLQNAQPYSNGVGQVRSAGRLYLPGILASAPPTNQPPHTVEDTLAVSPGIPTSIDVLANDSDPNGDPLTVTDFTQPSPGVVIRVPVNTNVLQVTMPLGTAGRYNFSYTVSDGRGGHALETVSVQVGTATNRPPVALDDIIVAECSSCAMCAPLLVNDFDPDGDAIQLVSVERQEETAGIGGRTCPPGSVIVLSPGAGPTWTYVITDSHGATATGKVHWVSNPMLELRPPSVWKPSQATVDSLSPEIAWSQPNPTRNYEVRLEASGPVNPGDPNIADSRIIPVQSVETYMVTPLLRPAYKYIVKVRALPAQGSSQTPSQWSESRQFTTPSNLGMPTLISPENLAQLPLSAPIEFKWNGVPGASSRLQISVDSPLGHVIYEQRTTSTSTVLNPNIFRPNRTYYWQVVALRGEETGESLGTRSFITQYDTGFSEFSLNVEASPSLHDLDENHENLWIGRFENGQIQDRPTVWIQYPSVGIYTSVVPELVKLFDNNTLIYGSYRKTDLLLSPGDFNPPVLPGEHRLLAVWYDRYQNVVASADRNFVVLDYSNYRGMTNGQTLSRIAIGKGNGARRMLYSLQVPQLQAKVKFRAARSVFNPLFSDLDLRAKLDSYPTAASFDASLDAAGSSNVVLTVDNPEAGQWFFELAPREIFAFEGSVTAWYEPATPASLTNNVATACLALGSREERWFYIDVPAGQTELFIHSRGCPGSVGDANIYAKRGSMPDSLSGFEQSAVTGSSDEDIYYANPPAGRYFVMLRGAGGTAINSAYVVAMYRSSANLAPSVGVTGPLSGDKFLEHSEIRIRADAWDPDGSISLMRFQDNGNLIGSRTGPPWDLDFVDADATGIEAHTILITAQDDRGASTAVSRAISVYQDGHLHPFTVGSTLAPLYAINTTRNWGFTFTLDPSKRWNLLIETFGGAGDVILKAERSETITTAGQIVQIIEDAGGTAESIARPNAFGGRWCVALTPKDSYRGISLRITATALP